MRGGTMINMSQVAELLAGAQGDELDAVQRAVVREKVVRQVMAESGQGYKPAAEMVDATRSMDEEAVLELTEGQPTTLADALSQYIEQAESTDHLSQVVEDLTSILNYPWSGEEAILATHLHDHHGLSLRFAMTEAGGLEIQIGSNRWPVATVLKNDSRSVNQIVQDTAMAVYRAILVRVIGDRDHHVDLSRDDVRRIQSWLERPSGSLGTKRLTLSAGGTGGVIVRTHPYSWNSALASATRPIRADQR